MKSLVRISKKARDQNSKEYEQAVNEFMEKMGGIKKVITKVRPVTTEDWAVITEPDQEVHLDSGRATRDS